MKKIFAILMAAMLVFSLVACGGTETKPAQTEAEKPAEAAERAEAAEVEEAAEPVAEEPAPAAPETMEIVLGTSNTTMTVPASYTKGEVSHEDTDETQVAYYYSADSLVDFDVYHWAMATDETLEAAAALECEEFETELSQTEINGIPVCYYYATEESDGEEYKTVSYLAEDHGYFVEVVFWLDGETAEEEVAAMVETLKQGEPKELPEGVIALGTSSLTLKPEKAYVAGEITTEDTDECQVGYFYCEDSLVDFDVYHWAKASGETLEGAAEEEAAEFEAELSELEVNGIKLCFYCAEEESEEESYKTVTYIAEDGDYLVELVFWVDGEDAEAEVEAILSTLSR